METLVFLIFLTVLGFYSAPLIAWFGFIGIYAYFFFNAGIIFAILFFGSAILFLNKAIREKFVSQAIVDFIKKKGLLPKISATEEAALQAGTTWVESNFFKAQVDFNQIKNEPITKLTKEEQAFLDNEVETLCNMTTDWEIFQKRDLPLPVWKFIKEKKFFGMIIPKEYDGLGFSATAHSKVIEKLVSRSQVLAITVMVPNSLGPAELILKHGTQLQKDLYLKKLAIGKEVPCFALTEPNAGSDATSITSNGVLFKDENDEIKIKLNFEKRYITLGNIATLIGLAFQLNDPEHLLGEEEDLGITFALVNSKLEGVDNSKRHDPLGIPFVNSPLYGKDVIISLSDIIGEKEGIGHGWQMLVESLSIGRGISLPSVSLGGSKLALKTVSSYTNLREQFGLAIGNFEGIEEKIAKVAAFTYLQNAARNYTLDAIDNGVRPAVVNSIMKYHATEKFREVINDTMDILGGAAIIRGEKNLLAHAYFALPISITVEGANILTRNLMQFGQGLIKCHPYLYQQVKALEKGDTKTFDALLFSHIGLVTHALGKTVAYYFTRGYIAQTQGNFKRYKQKLVWVSSDFTFLSNLSLAIFGANIKKKENISARFGDILSWCYLITATLREFDNNPTKEHKDLVRYVCEYGFNQIQEAKEQILRNMPVFKAILPLIKINPFSLKPADALNKKIVDSLKNEKILNQLCDGIFMPKNENDALFQLDNAVKLSHQTQNIRLKIKQAEKSGLIKKQTLPLMIEEALSQSLITKKESTLLLKAHEAQQEVIRVDAFDAKVYKGQK
ncbi:MAG: acyl-CoA dehydrogenase [Candidatus Marinarcus sp.]|uniref:acyl-CoA dehydrogenase n=1 Tax=Candidatus Marinarcus sp. TaxID=3100987 RepID=UPI003B00FD48